MAEAYRSGLPVLFFPEGTTTDGAGVLAVSAGAVSLRAGQRGFAADCGRAVFAGFACERMVRRRWERMSAGGERWGLLRTYSGFLGLRGLSAQIGLAKRWWSERIGLFFPRRRRRGLPTMYEELGERGERGGGESGVGRRLLEAVLNLGLSSRRFGGSAR